MPQIIASDGCRIYYETRGSGAPVVLIPGLGGDGRFWDTAAALLDHLFLLIIVDHRGAGRSDRPEDGYSIARISKDVLEIMDAEGLANAHIVGHSTGGTVAQTLALDAPERVRRLVISGSWSAPDARFRTLFEARLALIEAGRPDIYQAFTHVLGYDAAYLAAHEETLARAVSQAEHILQPLAAIAARIRMLFDYDRAAELERIVQPALIIGAVDDILIPMEHSRRIAEAIPGASLVELDGGHFFPRTRVEAFVEYVTAFFESSERQELKCDGGIGRAKLH